MRPSAITRKPAPAITPASQQQRCDPRPRSTFVHYHPDARDASRADAEAPAKTVILRMRGRARAEIRQLKGEAKSKSHPLLRRGHSFSKVSKVTCDSLQQR
jgi:hypothetical protein